MSNRSWILGKMVSGEVLSSHFDYHYENLPMQYTDILLVVKYLKFHYESFDNYLILAQNIDCGYMYTLEPPRRERF